MFSDSLDARETTVALTNYGVCDVFSWSNSTYETATALHLKV